MKRAGWFLAAALSAACGAAPQEPAQAPAAEQPTHGDANAAAPTPPAKQSEASPAAGSDRARREQRVVELLEGRVPEDGLPTDSGGF